MISSGDVQRRAAVAIVGAVLALALLVGASLALAADGDSSSGSGGSAESQDLSASPLPDGAEELPAKRTATSRTFLLPDGSREARLYQAPVNYRDEDGEWQRIEEGLVGKDGSPLTNGESSFDLVAPARLGDGPIRFSKDGAWVASRLLGAPSGPVELAKDGTASYELANSEASIELSTLPNGVKENIEIASPSAPSSFRFELTASDGVAPTLLEDGSIEFRDQDDDLAAKLPAPFMYDSSGSLDGYSDAVEYRLEPRESGGWLLTVEASRDWLDDPERQWPAMIDPSILGPKAPYFDCTVYSAPTIELWNKCGQNGVPTHGAEVYERASGATEYSRTLAFFRLIGAIDPTADVISADMHLYAGEAAKYTNGLEATRLTVPWSSYVSWKYSGYPNCYTCAPWATPGGTGTEKVGEVATAARPGGSAAGWWNIPLQEKMVQEWVTGGDPVNFGLAVKQLGEQTFSCMEKPWACLYRKLNFESSAASSPSLRPYLSISYYPQVPASANAKLISPVDGTKTARRLRLQASWGSGITSITWQYREGKSGTFNEVPPAAVKDGEGKAIGSWPVGAGSSPSKPLYLDATQLSSTLRKHGGPVQIRAFFEGGKEGVGAPVEAELDPAIGSARDASTDVGPGSVDLLTGNLTVTKTDVSIPTFTSSLDFSRTFNSRDAGQSGDKGVLGQGWSPATPVEEKGTGGFRSLDLTSRSEEIEGQMEWFEFAAITGVEGHEFTFPKVGTTYLPSDDLPEFTLTQTTSSRFVLAGPDGTRVVFDNGGSGSRYLPIEVSRPSVSGDESVFTYSVVEGQQRLARVVAPAPGVSCTAAPTTTTGCKVLVFNYRSPAQWGGAPGDGDRLGSISYYAPGNGGPWTVAEYLYDGQGRLAGVTDPRITPALTEAYTYESTGQIKTITPPGLKPWTMNYGTLNEEQVGGRLLSVERASLVDGDPVAKTTIAYGVPLSGPGLPAMNPADVAEWGQTDAPLDATAVFPPDEVPTSSPPSSYSRATIYYMDGEGYAVNTATPGDAGTEKPSISTSETDRYGNVIRELTSQNRVRALEKEGAAARKTASERLDTTWLYEDEGTEMAEEIGPVHPVRIQEGALAGQVVEAHLYRHVDYDQVKEGETLPTPAPHLPTTEKTAAMLASNGSPHDWRTNKTEYNWTLRKPIRSIIDAGEGGLNLTSVTAYDKDTGLPIETRQPSDASTAGAGSTQITYWKKAKGGGAGAPACEGTAFVGLPCTIEPVAQPSTWGQPQIKVTKYAAYNALGLPTEVWEAPGKAALESAASRRTTATVYDDAGRVLTVKRTGGGSAVPMSKSEYSKTTGLPTTQRFVCESECGSFGPPTYSSSFGSAGTGNGQFNNPAGMAFDDNGDLWVVDRENNRVQKFNSKGEYLTSFGTQGTGNGQLERPSDIAVDRKGNLWVTESKNHRVQKFSPTGTYLAKYGSSGVGVGKFNNAGAVAVDPKGFVWVADVNNGRVYKLNENAELVKVVGSKGYGDGQLYGVGGLDIAPNGDLWVVNIYSARITVFNDAGEYLRHYLMPGGTGDGQFDESSALEIDDDGNVWIGDYGNNRIQMFNQDGEFVAKFGAPGSGAGQFNFSWPLGLAANSKGDIWVADSANNRVQKWTTSPGFDAQAVKTHYDALGRPTYYQDADGNSSWVTYDLLGRPVTTNDGKGTQTRTYDSTSGLLTKLEDSAAGTFTASYDADGKLIAEGLPNGLVAESSYDEAGQLTGLAYDKGGSKWLDFDAERSINGQIISQKSLTSHQEYSYDKAGRLVKTKDWDAAVGGKCTTREYVFGEAGYEQLAGKNSNRTRMMTRTPGVGGACTTTGGSEQKYEYDGADRLKHPGIEYDDFGRIKNLPAVFAGGQTLLTSYFSTDMVASQTQNGVTNTFQLDGLLRQRQRTQGGGLEGVEVFHYAGASDTPAWTQLGTKWSRNISGIGGGIGAIQDSSSGTLLQLTNLHGDVVATASLSTSATEPVARFEYDEFGVPRQGGTPQFGWLGSSGRRTELASGVIQMGARSYVPSVGRFISLDPIEGGSASGYDYGNADPINSIDLDGLKAKKKKVALANARTVPTIRSVPLVAAAATSAVGAPDARVFIGSPLVRNILREVKKFVGLRLPLAWGTCVHPDAFSVKWDVVKGLLGTGCVPKLLVTTVRSPAQIPAGNIAGGEWCYAVNNFFNVGSPVSMFLGALSTIGWCADKYGAYWTIPR